MVNKLLTNTFLVLFFAGWLLMGEIPHVGYHETEKSIQRKEAQASHIEKTIYDSNIEEYNFGKKCPLSTTKTLGSIGLKRKCQCINNAIADTSKTKFNLNNKSAAMMMYVLLVYDGESDNSKRIKKIAAQKMVESGFSTKEIADMPTLLSKIANNKCNITLDRKSISFY